ncbi:tRNA threonylcarbamoyl adenosine modification protein YeaZ [Sphingomonas gellani]|uniref:tRNA threonylcarbamoyl adenosine modification protein YeaZ n=1 Tax=Sphingomonas gellani TaxID=1166340 RepID=A0A1H8FUX8_9SPHN|nr:tRNA (adenosine(37)-N6)-threonylcarbamoyltransferase complex dimerization subunit type 1 TsaB [Sphingomonas gellani]SEN35340.1 tRNA threonylcarbamoyl adenosine modification protein YeaZ [Sphingomonas gellani]
MRTLVIETATAACSVALIDDGVVVAAQHVVVGRGHAERLVPMIAQLPDGGRADRILVDCGPGSFTGVRVGLAAARGLALGWSVPVAGYSSLALVAATAMTRGGAPEVAAVLEGGHGELFVQMFARPLVPTGSLASLRPDAALAAIGGRPAAGNGVRALLAIDPGLPVSDVLPNAAEAVRLPADLADLPPRPIYGRAPDAKLPGGVTPPAASTTAP